MEKYVDRKCSRWMYYRLCIVFQFDMVFFTIETSNFIETKLAQFLFTLSNNRVSWAWISCRLSDIIPSSWDCWHH
jgi:hypothetical protein